MVFVQHGSKEVYKIIIPIEIARVKQAAQTTNTFSSSTPVHSLLVAGGALRRSRARKLSVIDREGRQRTNPDTDGSFYLARQT